MRWLQQRVGCWLARLWFFGSLEGGFVMRNGEVRRDKAGEGTLDLR